jgi:hypothetical protein
LESWASPFRRSARRPRPSHDCRARPRANTVAPAVVATPIYQRFVPTDKLEETLHSFDGFQAAEQAGSLTWATGPQFPHHGTYAAYRSSKAALDAVTIFYAHALAADGIKVNALAPGLRRTDLNATAAASGGDPAEAAAGAVRLALLPDDGPSGEFLSWDGTQVPS